MLDYPGRPVQVLIRRKQEGQNQGDMNMDPPVSDSEPRFKEPRKL